MDLILRLLPPTCWLSFSMLITDGKMLGSSTTESHVHHCTTKMRLYYLAHQARNPLAVVLLLSWEAQTSDISMLNKVLVKQVGLFIWNWRLQSLTARKLLRKKAVGLFQQQIGTSYSFLEKVNTILPHLESKWLASLREFQHSIQSC